MEQIPVSVLDSWIGRKHFSSEQLSREQLVEYQIKKISETIKMARENSVFYKEKYKDLLGEKMYNAIDYVLSKKYKSHIRKTKIGFYSIYKSL